MYILNTHFFSLLHTRFYALCCVSCNINSRILFLSNLCNSHVNIIHRSLDVLYNLECEECVGIASNQPPLHNRLISWEPILDAMPRYRRSLFAFYFYFCFVQRRDGALVGGLALTLSCILCLRCTRITNYTMYEQSLTKLYSAFCLPSISLHVCEKENTHRHP